ncbi:MAG: spore coat associated protein CotJA [Oscillospiraceae bacterium]|jgi:hypothetical protein
MIINNPEAASDKCVPQETVIYNVSLANAYVPFQKLCNTFTPLGSLVRGTAFPPLASDYGWEKNRRMEVLDDE